MTLNKLASMIAKREGKKHQASIGDIREILRIICALDAEDTIKNKWGDSEVFTPMFEESQKMEAKIRKSKKKM